MGRREEDKLIIEQIEQIDYWQIEI